MPSGRYAVRALSRAMSSVGGRRPVVGVADACDKRLPGPAGEEGYIFPAVSRRFPADRGDADLGGRSVGRYVGMLDGGLDRRMVRTGGAWRQPGGQPPVVRL